MNQPMMNDGRFSHVEGLGPLVFTHVMAVRREPKRDIKLEHLPTGGARLHNERPPL